MQSIEFLQGRWYHGRVTAQSQVKTARLRAAAWLMEQASWSTGVQRLVLRRRAVRTWRLANQHG